MYKVIGSLKTRALRVVWMLEELGQPYELDPSGPHSETVKAASGQPKVPVLLTEGQVIRDSCAIMTYLADKHGALTCPAGSLERARQDAWTFRILDELEGPLWTASKHSFILPEELRVPEVKPTCKADYDSNLARIMQDLDGPFVMGDRFTLPDILLTHCGAWARSAGFTDGPEAFGAYVKRTRSRPAFKAFREKFENS